MERIGLVVHPRRDLSSAFATIEAWAAAHGCDVVQIRSPGQEREMAPAGDPASCDLIVALGGDGTTLHALHAATAAGRPVLGVACGSLGALTSTTADRLAHALDEVAAGDWEARLLPALAVHYGDGHELTAINDLVLVRAGAGQVTVEVRIDDEVLVRFAGDGLVAGTPLGSTAYTIASGGPMLAPGLEGLVLTPLAPHGGVCPPAVTAPGTQVAIRLDPGNGGARVEVDGQIKATLEPLVPVSFALAYLPDHARLIMLGDQEPALAGLRRRRIIIDSPRVLARDDREAAGEVQETVGPAGG
jgi:NAD+ kinase